MCNTLQSFVYQSCCVINKAANAWNRFLEMCWQFHESHAQTHRLVIGKSNQINEISNANVRLLYKHTLINHWFESHTNSSVSVKTVALIEHKLRNKQSKRSLKINVLVHSLYTPNKGMKIGEEKKRKFESKSNRRWESARRQRSRML